MGARMPRLLSYRLVRPTRILPLENMGPPTRSSGFFNDDLHCLNKSSATKFRLQGTPKGCGILGKLSPARPCLQALSMNAIGVRTSRR